MDDFSSGTDFFSGGSSGIPDFSSVPSFDVSNLGAPTQNAVDPSATPGGSFGGFNFNPLASSGPSSGITTQPNFAGGVASPTAGAGTFGGTAPLSQLSIGSDASNFSSPTSASADPLAALLNPQPPANQQVGPTNFSASNAPGATPQTPQGGNSLLDLIGLGTGNGKTDQSLLAGGVSGLGLAYNLLSGSPSASAEKQLKNIAGSQNSQGQQLEGYLANGTLPPGAQQWVNQQTAGQQAAIRAKYAQLGMSGSTAESQELNNVQEQATSQMFTIASQLLNTGVSETSASGTLYNYLMQAQNADAKDVSSAIQNFVASLAGGGSPGTVSLKLGQ